MQTPTAASTRRSYRRAVLAGLAAAAVSMLAARLAPPDERLAAAVFGPADPTALRHGEALASDGTLVAIASPRDGDDANERASVSLGEIVRASSDGPPRFALESEVFDGAAGEHFGCAVAVKRIRVASHDSCESLTLSAIGADNAHGVADATGAVDLYRRDETRGSALAHAAWLREARLFSTHSEPGDRFGRSVALGGARAPIAAVGAPYADRQELLDAGAVHIFRRYARADGSPLSPAPTTEAPWVHAALDDDGGAWTAGPIADGTLWLEHAVLTGPAPSTSAHFGSAIAAWGEFVAVAAPDLRVGAASGCGGVWIYEVVPGGCTLVAELPAPHAHPWQWFGAALALDGTTLAVGVPGGRRTADGTRCGRVELYDLAALLESPSRATANRTTIEPPFLEPGASFGASLAVHGATLAVGAPGADRPDPARGPSITLEDAGACFLVDRDTAALAGVLAPPDPAPMSLFGASCALVALRLEERGATRSPAALVGHRYLEEESSRPSPGAALYTPP